MVKVLERVSKKITCPGCRAKLEYTIEDIETSTSTDEFGEQVSCKYITCPDCNAKIIIK